MTQSKPAHRSTPRIGLFGGTFNPIHLGHLKAAENVRQQFGLDQITFIPCALPPHKSDDRLASAQDRLEMVRIAIKYRSAMKVSDIEIQRGGPSYTIDTLRALNSRCKDGTAFFFLMGMDAFLEIHSWKSYLQLLDMTALIVVTRTTPELNHLSLQSTALAYAKQYISDQYILSKNDHVLAHPRKHAIYIATVAPVAIASTQIRDMIRIGEPTHDWVGPDVSDYIENKGLYR